MKLLLTILILAGSLSAQIAPPTMTVKKRHSQGVRLTWDYTDAQTAHFGSVLYFSVKSCTSLDEAPTEIKQVPSGERATDVVALFTRASKFVYYVISVVYDGPTRESLYANTVAAERIGQPPPELEVK